MRRKKFEETFLLGHLIDSCAQSNRFFQVEIKWCQFYSAASSSGTRLHRGYVEEATLEDKPSPTTHIVFVVHGIGQKIEQGRIIRNTAM